MTGEVQMAGITLSCLAKGMDKEKKNRKPIKTGPLERFMTACALAKRGRFDF